VILSGVEVLFLSSSRIVCIVPTLYDLLERETGAHLKTPSVSGPARRF
jgi:hypothetical protein